VSNKKNLTKESSRTGQPLEQETLRRIFTIGETTYDIQFRDGSPNGGCGGGSAFNSSISLGRCRLPVSLISTYATDKIGDLANDLLLNNGVDCSQIKRFEGRSRVALAFFDQNQVPNYSFYPASEEAIPYYPEPQERDIILLGSSFSLRDKGREELLEYLQKCKQKGCIIIYDPNARRHLADDPLMVKKIMENMALSTIVKGSDEDFHFIFKSKNSVSVSRLVHQAGPQYLFYTKGSKGVEFLSPDAHLEMDPLKIKVVSTIGAGDNFSAGIVFGIYYRLLNHTQLKDFSLPDWQYIMTMGNFFAARVCESSENYISKEAAQRLTGK
jgi:fructokinase